MKSNSNQDSGEANFEVQLNFNTNEFKIVHGNFGDNYPDLSSNNVFVGFQRMLHVHL